MAKELFAMVPGYNDRYLVSNYGKVISLNIGSEMAQYVQKNGYAAVKHCGAIGPDPFPRFGDSEDRTYKQVLSTAKAWWNKRAGDGND